MQEQSKKINRVVRWKRPKFDKQTFLADHWPFPEVPQVQFEEENCIPLIGEKPSEV